MRVPANSIDGLLVPATDPFFSRPEGLAQHRRHALTAINVALEHLDTRAVAVDIGAHVGIWTRELVDLFEHVIAFEPDQANVILLTANLGDRDNLRIFPMAVADRSGRVAMQNEHGGSATGYCAKANGSLAEPWAPCLALDSLKLPRLDLLKIDVEGAESMVISGAEKAIARHKPVVIIEDNFCSERYGIARGTAQKDLEAMGYIEVGSVEFMADMFDKIMVPVEAAA